jgi:hypothetical protein
VREEEEEEGQEEGQESRLDRREPVMGPVRNEETTMAFPASSEHLSGSGLRRLLLAAAVGLVLALLGAIWAGKAEADVPIHGFDTTSTSSQAGGHGDVTVRMEVGTFFTEGVELCFCNAVKNIVVNTPAGLVGTPGNIPQCSSSEFSDGKCPVDTQIGVVSVRLLAPLPEGGVYFVQPLYNMEPRPDQLALFATIAPLVQTPIYTVVSARTESDYGLEFNTFGLPRLIPPNEITLVNWGVPAADTHDDLRWPVSAQSKSSSCQFSGGNPLPALARDEFPDELCSQQFGGPNGPNPAVNPPTPFLLNPTECVGPLQSTLDTEGYEFDRDHAVTGFPETTGCDQLSFNPSLSAKTTTQEADAPSGLDVNLKVPQFLSPSAPSPSAIKATRVSLPPGLTIDPNVADGKVACTAGEAGIGTRSAAACPDFSKIGSLTIVSSALPAALPGSIYIGEPLPGDRYRIYLIADGFSLHIKLPGTVKADPQTGQLTVVFDNLPQTPFQEFDMHFFGAERGMLATPQQCGTYPVHTEFVPWNSALPNQSSTQFFEITSGPGGRPCPPAARPFAPTAESGVTDNTGGAHTTFGFSLSRRDGDQHLSGVEVSTPAGFAAKIAGIPYCSEAAIAAAGAAPSGRGEMFAPSCPAASRVGVSSVKAGAGSRPVSIPGTVYLAGPYKGAPLSLAVITPAVVGPYDLGNVLVRVALHIDPVDVDINAVSDPLPQILEGVPLRLRNVLLTFNRPGFALNPTDCSPAAVLTNVTGDQGAGATLRNHFQVANCGALDFEPKFSLKLAGGLNRRGHPAIHATYRAKPGEANSKVIAVSLPKNQQLDSGHVRNICTRVQFRADSCPASSRLGTAQARTPLLDTPLRGDVYLRSSDNKLPDLVMDLKGQIDIELVGRIDSAKNGALRTTFGNVPDAPVTRFDLRLAGGKKGLIVNSESLCAGKPKQARIRQVGQNGVSISSRTKIQVSCGKKGAKKKRRAQPRTGA